MSVSIDYRSWTRLQDTQVMKIGVWFDLYSAGREGEGMDMIVVLDK